MNGKQIAVFCAASVGHSGLYVEAARALGESLGRGGYALVYGGASLGTMGTLADAAIAAGASVTGVMPRLLVDREIAHAALTARGALEVVHSMAERKARMMALADAFVVMPGGLGTLEEAVEMLSAAQLGLHAKPIIFCDVAGYWAPLFQWFDHAVAQGLLASQHRARATLAPTVEGVMTLLARQDGQDALR